MLTTFLSVIHIEEALISLIGYETTNLISVFILQNKQIPTINDAEDKIIPIIVKPIKSEINPAINKLAKLRPITIGYIILHIYKSNYLYILKYFVQEENPFM